MEGGNRMHIKLTQNPGPTSEAPALSVAKEKPKQKANERKIVFLVLFLFVSFVRSIHSLRFYYNKDRYMPLFRYRVGGRNERKRNQINIGVVCGCMPCLCDKIERKNEV